MSAYAFPPIALIQKVLDKVTSDRCRLILIAPNWPRRNWFPHLINLLRSRPFRLPTVHNLLSQHQGKVIHPDPGIFQLVAWPLSGDHYDRKDFLEELQSSSPALSEHQREQFIKADSKSSHAGVLKGAWIRFKHL